MNVLIIGSGGREHAFAWKIKQSHLLDELFIAPGNAGTAALGTNLPIGVSDFDSIKSAVLDHNIELVVVGPEAPLVDGIVDFFRADPDLANVGIVGPDKFAAQLEGSKDFAKEFMARHGIPTARYQTFSKETLADAYNFLETLKPPYVLKADGLAAGKGVLIIDDLDTARRELELMFDGKFGSAGAHVVIEEFLDGIELSVFVLTDGEHYVMLPEAKDYKRIGEGDTGLNTGGMGAVSPVPFATDSFIQKVEERIVKPTMAGFQSDGMNYNGFVFVGLMKVGDDPFVIEYNIRMGDPETEVVFPRVESDLLDLLMKAANKGLNDANVTVSADQGMTLMLVSGGYPEGYEKGKVISGHGQGHNGILFHAGTKLDGDSVLTNGGRVISITTSGEDINSCRTKAYEIADSVDFEGKYFRRDIGLDLLRLETAD